MATFSKVGDERALKAAIKNQIFNATGYLGGEITEDRRRAMDYYLGNPLGNEVDGRSQVVSTDVQDVIESLMPDLVRMFTASDQAVRYEPEGPEDEEAAKQATDYANLIWMRDNDGFKITHDWIKDALLQINGIIKIWWDESVVTKRVQLSGLSEDEMADILSDPKVTAIEHTERYDPDAAKMLAAMDIDAEEITPEQEALLPPELVSIAKVHDLTIKRETGGPGDGRIRIANVPPEEFLISRRAVSIEDSPFVAHWVQRTVSELIEQGYDAEVLRDIPSDDEQEFNEERVARFNRDDEWPFQEQEVDETMREIRIYENYLMVDWEGTGVAELRKVTTAGPAYVILDNEPVAAHPFQEITAIRMPHKFFGRSMAELTEDIQLVKTSLLRSVLDNSYNVNNARNAISNKVELEDVLTNRVAAPIRVNTDAPDVAGHIQPVPTEPIGHHLYPALEYMDTVRETRTGVTRYSQGLDADSLNKTAFGINQILGRSQMRTLLIAQVMGEGFKGAFRKILWLITAHQQKVRTVRLRGEWVDIDPRAWNADMDVTTEVGLGQGTQEQQLATMQYVLQLQQTIVKYQGGVKGPLIKLEHIRSAASKTMEYAGIKSSEPYIAEVDDDDQKKVDEDDDADPKLLAEQMKDKREREKLQADTAVKMEELKVKTAELAIKEKELQLKAQELGLDADKAARELDHKEREIDLAHRKVSGDHHIARAANNKKIMEAHDDGELGDDPLVAEVTEAVEDGMEKGVDRIVALLKAPKNLVRDESGTPTGVDGPLGFQAIKRDADGRPSGLGPANGAG